MLFRFLPKSLISITTTILVVGMAGCNTQSGKMTYSVKTVSDGDTIAVTDSSNKEIKVRFACVDAPEVPHTTNERKSRKLVDKNQFEWGAKAQQRLRELVKQGGDRVLLTITDTDRYGRKISEVRLPDGTFVQEVLLKEGLVQVYRPYLKDCPSAAIVTQAEAMAKHKSVGVWSDSKYIPAWEWRHGN